MATDESTATTLSTLGRCSRTRAASLPSPQPRSSTERGDSGELIPVPLHLQPVEPIHRSWSGSDPLGRGRSKWQLEDSGDLVRWSPTDSYRGSASVLSASPLPLLPLWVTGQGHPLEDSRGDESAHEDEDGTSEFCAPLFDRSAQSATYLQTDKGHSDTHHGDDNCGLHEWHLVSAESKADHQIVNAQSSAGEDELPRSVRPSHLRDNHPGLDERIETCGDKESAAQGGGG